MLPTACTVRHHEKDELFKESQRACRCRAQGWASRCEHLPGSTSQLGLKLWLAMSMSGSSAAGCCGPRTLNAREDVAARAQPGV